MTSCEQLSPPPSALWVLRGPFRAYSVTPVESCFFSFSSTSALSFFFSQIVLYLLLIVLEAEEGCLIEIFHLLDPLAKVYLPAYVKYGFRFPKFIWAACAQLIG